MVTPHKNSKDKKPDPKAKKSTSSKPSKPAPKVMAKSATAVKPTASKKEMPKPVPAKKDSSKAAPKGADKKVVKKPEPPKKAASGHAEAKPAAAKGAKPAVLIKGGKPEAKATVVAKKHAPGVPTKGAAKEVPAAKAPKISSKEAPATGMGQRGASAKSGPLGKAQAAAVAKAARALAATKGAAAPKIVVADVKPVPVKKPVKVFFQEVQTGAERIIKRGDKSAATVVPVDIQARRKGGGEESPEELVERIERELEHQHIFKRNVLRPQLCTKCGINAVSDRFTIDKELGYCDDCAEILHLGETKEARKIDFHPSLMKKDGEAAAEGEGEEEEEDEDEGEGPPPGAVEPE